MFIIDNELKCLKYIAENSYNSENMNLSSSIYFKYTNLQALLKGTVSQKEAHSKT